MPTQHQPRHTGGGCSTTGSDGRDIYHQFVTAAVIMTGSKARDNLHHLVTIMVVWIAVTGKRASANSSQW